MMVPGGALWVGLVHSAGGGRGRIVATYENSSLSLVIPSPSLTAVPIIVCFDAYSSPTPNMCHMAELLIFP